MLMLYVATPYMREDEGYTFSKAFIKDNWNANSIPLIFGMTTISLLQETSHLGLSHYTQVCVTITNILHTS